jgi:hypothetical protein
MCLAAAQVIECRRILKWTYAYGYYNFEDEDLPQVRTINQSTNLASVAMRFTEKFMPAIHRISLGLVVVTFSSPKKCTHILQALARSKMLQGPQTF